MAENCFPILDHDNKHLRLRNDTGAAVVTNEFTVIGDIPGVADEGIANGADGSFDIEPNILLQTDDFVTSEGTFAAANGIVYFDPTTKKFSDTPTAGYYEVGQVTATKGSKTYIEFVKFARAVLVAT